MLYFIKKSIKKGKEKKKKKTNLTAKQKQKKTKPGQAIKGV